MFRTLQTLQPSTIRISQKSKEKEKVLNEGRVKINKIGKELII